MAQFYVTAHEDWDGLTSDFGYWLWNVLMKDIPYDTGNLRSSFLLKSNTKKKIRYSFDKTKAYYVDYLEEGVGPVTKYKGFIKNTMVGNAISELLYFIKTNETGILTNKPTVVLKTSSHSNPFPYERRILKQEGMHLNYLSADERRELSKIMYRSSTNDIRKSFGGRTPTSIRRYKRSYSAEFNTYYIDNFN